jgi:PiT family inorganic phosphate transporter
LHIALLIAIAASLFIAAANGANDVSKGIATLAGGHVTNYRRAILWGAVWTTIGSVASFGFAKAMVSTFGKGLLAASVNPSYQAAIASILGATLCVGIATRLKLPVSTTHAIVGSVAGVAIVAYGLGGMRWNVLVAKVALPLLLSPLASLILTRLALSTWEYLSPGQAADCVCAEVLARPAALTSAETGASFEMASFPEVTLSVCREPDRIANAPNTLAVTINGFHWLTSAATSFARGLNDAPKMVALLLSASALSGAMSVGSLWAFLLIATGILVGSGIAGRGVTAVLGEGITRMDHRQAFVANLITAALVGPGAALGLPMSTTHVASGAIVGVGIGSGRAEMNWRTLREIALAWIFTIPLAAFFGITTFELLRIGRIG